MEFWRQLDFLHFHSRQHPNVEHTINILGSVVCVRCLVDKRVQFVCVAKSHFVTHYLLNNFTNGKLYYQHIYICMEYKIQNSYHRHSTVICLSIPIESTINDPWEKNGITHRIDSFFVYCTHTLKLNQSFLSVENCI